VKLETNFDPAIGKVNVIPQDIGRVLLNLYNNAFYAVTEKSKTAKANYVPKVTLRSRVMEEGNRKLVELSIRDNGNGIPEKIREKIFQPFFTTKPAGQGTGLGLSLSYDIVKAHGGSIRVDTEAGQFTEFMVTIPME
jgi:signal transduction histidine kinase